MNAEERNFDFLKTGVSDRGLERYSRDLDLSVEQMQGKKILDAGAGLRLFAIEGMKHGLDIHSLEPRFQEPETFFSAADKKRARDALVELDDEQKRTLDLKTIPETIENNTIPDEAFDLIIAHTSIPFYSSYLEHIKIVFKEFLRILKPGGEIRICTCWKSQDGKFHLTVADQERKGITDEQLQEVLAEVQSMPGVSLRMEKQGTLIVNKKEY